MGRWKWLYPGMRLKRWMSLCALGLIMVGVGAVKLLANEGLTVTIAGGLVLLLGVVAVVTGMRKMIKSVVTIFLPHREQEMVELMFARRQRERGPRIVALGGGTGLSVLLSGIKGHTDNITAVVTVTDDGGSSGRLRDQFGTLPPGDIRNCLVALAEAEPLMRDLFQYRFRGPSDLEGHSFGNLFILAMSQVTGDFERAIRESSRVLAIRGRVLPSTLERVMLVAEHEDGTQSKGETTIAHYPSRIKRLLLQPDSCDPTREALEAIEAADAILLGPGSLFTSVLPNLLVKGLGEAVSQSKALKVYICNVMTQPNETTGLTASDHLKALIEHTSPNIITCCIINRQPIPLELLSRYQHLQAYPVEPDVEEVRRMGYRVVEGELVASSQFVRHDPIRLARQVMELVEEWRKL